MKKSERLRKLGALVALVGTVALSSACSGASNNSANGRGGSPNLDDGTLDVFTSADLPPFSYHSSDGTTVVGLETDLLAAIADKLDVGVEYRIAPFDTMIPGINNNRADVMVMAMVDTPERREQVDFIDLYKTNVRVLTRAGNPVGLDLGSDPAAPDPLGLCGRTGAAVTGSQQEAFYRKISEWCLEAGRDPISPLIFSVGTQEYLAVKSGRADFNIQNAANAAYFLERNPDIEAMPGALQPPDAALTGWIFKKGNTELQQEVLGAINALITEGTWAEIFANYGLTENDYLTPPMRNSEPVEVG